MDGSQFVIEAQDEAAAAAPGPKSRTHEAAAPDLPKAAGFAVIGAFGAAMLSFMALFSGSAEARFMTAISLAYLVAYLTVPVVFFRIQPKSRNQVRWLEFLARGLDTWTGHLTGRQAFVQIMTVPAALVLAAIAMGVTLQVAR